MASFSNEGDADIDKENQILIILQKKIPDELNNIIFSYIPYKVKTFLNKEYYTQYHHIIRNYILSGNMENYIRDILRRDNDFVFLQLLHENFVKWIFDIKNYKYKNSVYKNYLYFIKDFCLIHDSIRCRNIVNQFLEKHELCQNQHKKNTVRNIRWRI
jgi:hypothetical protein